MNRYQRHHAAILTAIRDGATGAWNGTAIDRNGHIHVRLIDGRFHLPRLDDHHNTWCGNTCNGPALRFHPEHNAPTVCHRCRRNSLTAHTDWVASVVAELEPGDQIVSTEVGGATVTLAEPRGSAKRGNSVAEQGPTCGIWGIAEKLPRPGYTHLVVLGAADHLWAPVTKAADE